MALAIQLNKKSAGVLLDSNSFVRDETLLQKGKTLSWKRKSLKKTYQEVEKKNITCKALDKAGLSLVM